MRAPHSDGTLRSVTELLVIASLLYGYILLKLSFCSEMLDIDKDPTINQIVFRNVTITYTYLLLPNVSKCNGLMNEIVAVVLSTPEHVMIRQAIRKSWASPSKSESIANGFVTVYFLLSAPKSDREMEAVLAEQKSYHDLIVTDMEESYENLVYKVSAMMSFFLKYCKKADFLMKVDDDVAIHLNRMITHWKKTRHNDNDIYCRLWSGLPPIRDPYSKWYIPYEIWPKKVYPSYCDGPIYLIGRSAIQSIFGIALHCYDPFPLEDVFFTGILASAIGILRIDWQFKIQSVDE
ncbi:Hexosyltransferase, partial [Trichostrongylus colubriformis]